MKAPHYSDPSSLQAIRRAARRTQYRRVAFGSLAVGLIAAAFAAERAGQGEGFLSKLGLDFNIEDDRAAWSEHGYTGSNNSNAAGGWDLTAGFYEFDDGPEEDARKGRFASADLSQTSSPFFAEEYYKDHDTAASQGFLGFWASLSLGGRENDKVTRADNRGSGRTFLADLASATPRFERANRIRTSRTNSHDRQQARSGPDHDREPFLSRLFGAKKETAPDDEASSASQKTVGRGESHDSEDQVKSGNDLPQFLGNLFKKKSKQAGR